jgi:hypothetical protein
VDQQSLQFHCARHSDTLVLTKRISELILGKYIGELHCQREMEHSRSGEVSLDAEWEDLFLFGLYSGIVSFGSQLETSTSQL